MAEELEWKSQEIQQAYAEMRPQIGNYGWMWTILRYLARKRGGFPWTAWMRLKRYGNPAKPYFIGTTSEGTRYLGDYRELYTASFAVQPDDDAPMFALLKEQAVKTEGVALDIGANMGVLTAAVARILPADRQALAFEPIPETARRAAATLALNRVTNARLFQTAIGDQNGTLTFHLASGHSDIASVYAFKQREEAESQPTMVPCRTLDTLMQKVCFEKVGLLKLDVEGHELSALRGARQLIARDRPLIIFEYNYGMARQVGWKAEDAAALICETHPYDFVVIEQDGRHTAFPPVGESQNFVNILSTPR